jgi:hypothetical protein
MGADAILVFGNGRQVPLFAVNPVALKLKPLK